MNCLKCKSPNKENLTECEWCGVSLEPQSTNAFKKSSTNGTNMKALKYTIYFVLFVLVLVAGSKNETNGTNAFSIYIVSIITIELYSYLKNRFSK